MIEILNDDQNLIYLTIQDLFMDEENRLELHIEDTTIFYKNKETYEKAKKNQFYGKYTLTLHDNNETSTYDFIYMEQFIDPWCDNILKLIPVRFTDEKIFQYMENGRLDFPEDTQLKLTLTYTPYKEILQQVKEDELITFAGEIEKITSHKYVHNDEYDVNFQTITDEEGCDYEIIHYTYDQLDEIDMENMVNDKYMGKMRVVTLTSIGMPLINQYNIIEVTDDGITCESCDTPCPEINNLIEVGNDSNMRVVKCTTITSFDYIPYDKIIDDVVDD